MTEDTISRQSLLQAVKVIRDWHGAEAFQTYYDHSPGMKLIRESLGSYDSIKNEPIEVRVISVKGQ